MRKILCDRCGAEIPLKSRIGYVAVNWRAPSDESLMYENPYEGYDFCEQCMHDIVEVIDNVVLCKEEDKTEQETPEELARRFVEAMKEVSVEVLAPDPEEPEEAESGPETAVKPDIQGAVEKTVKNTEAAVEAWKDMTQSADAAAEGVQAMAAEARQTAPLEFPEEPVGRLADNPPPKQFVNLRELRELVKAGKKPKEIAEHFGISMASYYNYKKKAEAMWNAGML